MNAKLRAALSGVRAILVVIAGLVVIAPEFLSRIPFRRAEGFLPPSWYQTSPDGAWYAMGTDYLGRPFVPVLCHAASATMRTALVGTVIVAVCCLLVGILHGATSSRGVEAVVAAGNLGLMAVPEAAVIVTLATAWPRTSSPLYVNSSMLAVLILFAIPTGSRLIAERVRAVGRTGFVAASRAYGATYRYVFVHDIWPHLQEDVAWIVAATLPRFLAIEVGMAYLGVEYRDFEGLGRLLAKSFSNLSVGTAVFQMLVTILVILWVALLPQLAFRSAGPRALAEGAP